MINLLASLVCDFEKLLYCTVLLAGSWSCSAVSGLYSSSSDGAFYFPYLLMLD